MKSFLCILSIFASLLLLSFTQPLHQEPVIIEIENLSPKLFKTYMLGSLENDEVEIVEACVPAKLLSVKYTGEGANGESILLNYFTQVQQTGTVKILNDFTMTDFTHQCQQARLGK